MAGTPRWGALHLRLSAAARDAVSSPTAEGVELKYLDREAYLNYAWQKYVSLFYSIYRNQLQFIQKALQGMAKVGTISMSGISEFDTFPSDFGLLLKLSRSDVSSISIETPESWLDIKNGKLPSKTPTADNQYALVQNDRILIAPTNIAPIHGENYDIAYLISPFIITYNATEGVDIPLDVLHFDTIVGFALASLLNDRQQFELAKSKLEEAYQSAPYPLRTSNG